MLQDLLKEKTNKNAGFIPEFFNFKKKEDQQKVATLLKAGVIQYVIDDYEEELRELFALHNPRVVHSPHFKEEFQKYLLKFLKEKQIWQEGIWVFYPWLSKLVHILPEADFIAVRTSRNKNLINSEEQERFYNAVVGIGGLSVGSAVVIALVLQGGARYIKLADMDQLALSNTNRIRVGIDNLGVLKTEMTARHIYEINPYAEVEIFSNGLTPNTIEDFFVGNKKLDVVIDEMDNLGIKYLLREKAKKYRLPIVMAADNGDNSVVDIERYDLDPNTPFFHGRMGEVSYEILSSLDKFGIGKLITKHVGPENVTERMQQSLLEIGKTIVSWPQLGGAALINGSAVAYCVRKIINKEPIESNRAIISLDEKLIPDFNSAKAQAKRKKTADSFRKIFGL